MVRRHFWRGFAMGAAAGAGAGIAAALLPQLIGKARSSRIVRLQKSIQIGQPVEQVFSAWTDLERLPSISEYVTDLRTEGDRSHWKMRFNGRDVEWNAEIEQFIPNQSIGWKSVGGPKHTGRITFSPMGNDTLVLVTMNYAPPSRVLRPFVASLTGHLEGVIEKVLRDFKASLEGKGREARETVVRGSGEKIGPAKTMTQSDAERATGTFGAPAETVDPRFGGRVTPGVNYTRPPDAKS